MRKKNKGPTRLVPRKSADEESEQAGSLGSLWKCLQGRINERCITLPFCYRVWHSRYPEEISLLRKFPFFTLDIQMKELSSQESKLLKLNNKDLSMEIFRVYCLIEKDIYIFYIILFYII